MEELTEDEKRALRGSKFAPLTSLPSSSRSQLPRFLFYSLGLFSFFSIMKFLTFLQIGSSRWTLEDEQGGGFSQVSRTEASGSQWVVFH